MAPLNPAFVSMDKPEGTIEGRVNATVVALRTSPDRDSQTNKLGNVENGTTVYIYYKEGDFYYVLIGTTKTKGYLWAEFVTPNGVVPAKPAN